MADLESVKYFETEEQLKLRNLLVRRHQRELRTQPVTFAAALVSLAARILKHEGDRRGWAELTHAAWRARGPIEPPVKRRWWKLWGRA